MVWDVVVVLKIGVVLGHEHLVVDVAVVVERLGAADAEILGLVINFSTHTALPVHGFLLVSDFAPSSLMGILPQSFGLFLGHSFSLFEF